MEIIAEITTTRAEENQEPGLIVPGDRTAPISPRIGDLFHLDLHAPTGIFQRADAIDPDQPMLLGDIPRSIGSLIRIDAAESQTNRPDHVSRKSSAPPAHVASTPARISDAANGRKTEAGMTWTPIKSIHHAAGLIPIRSIRSHHAAGLIPIRSVRSHRVIARKPVRHACGKTTAGARGERHQETVVISSWRKRRHPRGEMR
jgi:hypothetical protein